MKCMINEECSFNFVDSEDGLVAFNIHRILYHPETPNEMIIDGKVYETRPVNQRLH